MSGVGGVRRGTRGHVTSCLPVSAAADGFPECRHGSSVLVQATEGVGGSVAISGRGHLHTHQRRKRQQPLPVVSCNFLPQTHLLLLQQGPLVAAGGQLTRLRHQRRRLPAVPEAERAGREVVLPGPLQPGSHDTSRCVSERAGEWA